MKKIFVLSLFSLIILPLVVGADSGEMMDFDGIMGCNFIYKL